MIRFTNFQCINVLILMATHFEFISGETTWGVEEWQYMVIDVQNCTINTFLSIDTINGYRYEMLSMPCSWYWCEAM